MKIKKHYLILAFVTVSVIALLYGVSPAWFAATFLDVSALDPNIAHILRAVMGLYLALGFFWLYAAFHPPFRNTAILTTAIFSGGLAAGRIVSLFSEGRPAPLLILYIFMEAALAPFALWLFRRPD